MISIDYILMIVLIIAYTLFIALPARDALHYFQQNRYELFRFRKWQKSNVTKTYPLYILVTWFVIVILSLIIKSYTIRLFMVITILIIMCIYKFNNNQYRVIIKPLVYTKRVIRQVVLAIIIYLAFIYGVITVRDNYWLMLLLLGIFSIYQMLYVSFIALLLSPVENAFKKRFMAKASKKLAANKHIEVIGITGSYGKTSSKNIIDSVLSKKYYCLSTPASYNTPLGIAITINEHLKPLHELFICEMGADKKGEISELVNFVHPKVGVVTSIGPQHLTTFKTQENIIKEKMQLVEMMPSDGLVVLNKDEKYIREFNITSKAKEVWYGIENEDADIVAKDIEYSKEGSTFNVNIDGNDYQFNTRLLGLHNIYNILASIAIGLHYQISINELQQAIRQIDYIPHRLELKRQADYTIIDNAFNSNPVSSKMSLDVLSKMPNKRICITPGMIDLGEKQDYYNEEFGRYFLGRCDEVILVGRNQTQAIYKGLKESGYDMRKVHVVNKIFDAYKVLNRIKEPECYVLLENDLPDAFNN